MELSDLISQDRIVCNSDAASKKRALEQLSELLAHDQEQISALQIFDSLLSRERLGGTGIGYGVAIPHARLQNCEHPSAAFIQLKDGIDYDSLDKQPVDLLFALVVPEKSTSEHLQILAMLAGLFNDENFREQLRNCHDAGEMYRLLVERTRH